MVVDITENLFRMVSVEVPKSPFSERLLMAKSLRKVVHTEEKAKFYRGDHLMTPEIMKKLLGWRSEKDEGETKEFGTDYLFKDRNGEKIRLDNNETNRPFRLGLAMEYANEMLRGKWELTGEPIIIDETDNFQSGQHRGVGLILAEQIRKENPEPWKEYGVRGPIAISILVVTGISQKASVVDRIDLGQKRSLGDVLYRNHEFVNEKSPLTSAEQKMLNNTLANAARVVWLATGGKLVSDAPKFFHSEALDLLERHPRLKEAVEFIVTADGEEKSIRSLVSLGTAAGMFYLMGTCETDTKKWDDGSVEEPNFKSWESKDPKDRSAETFWELFASGAGLDKDSPILVLRRYLASASASGAHERDEIVGVIKNAWIAYYSGKKVSGVNDLKPGRVKVKEKSIIDMPHVGGLDVHRDPPPKVEKAPKAEKPSKAAKGGKKGRKKNTKSVSYQFTKGDQVWVKPTGKDSKTKKPFEAYEGRVSEIADDGKVTVVPLSDTTIECEVNPADGDYVGLEKPAA